MLLLLWNLPGAFADASSVNSTPLPDTGQTESYTDTFGEDSDYLINPPSYTKLDANGNDLPDSAESPMSNKAVSGTTVWETDQVLGQNGDYNFAGIYEF